MVALNFCIASSSPSGVSRSISTVEAPYRSGKHSSPPRPKVNASGGVPQKTSPFTGFRQERGNRSHIAITSRWKWTVPLGVPVVPEVNAISAGSSAAVSTLPKVPGLVAQRASSEPASSSYQYLTCLSPGQACNAAMSSASSRLSQSAWVTCALATISVSSLARSSGMVPTTMPPALNTPNQQAAIIGLLGPRSSTRLPGLRPMSSTSTRAIRLACARSSP